jgi:hypothetical protein
LLDAVLLQKAYGEASLKDVEELLSKQCAGLRIKLAVIGFGGSDWIRIQISGEDERVAERFLDREVGLAPVSTDLIAKFSVLRGAMTSQISRTEAAVDLGIISPQPAPAALPLQSMQAQLADGRKFALKRIADVFGLTDNLPVKVRVLEVDSHGIICEFADDQLETFHKWTCSRLDRLIALGIQRAKLEIAVKKARLNRDIIGVESLGLLEHALVCKLGTDATGLFSKLGRFMRAARFSCFSPRRIMNVLGGRWCCDCEQVLPAKSH